MSHPAPKLPFDAWRVVIRTDGVPSGISVTKVQVREIYPSAKSALIGYGRNLHSEAVVPFAELCSTEQTVLKAVRASVPRLAYRSTPKT